MSKYFGTTKKLMAEIKNSLKEIEIEVNTVEVDEIQKLVKKYDVILKDDVEEKDLILKYETFYDQLNESVINKRKEVNDIHEMITNFFKLTPNDNYTTILNKKKDNVNQIIDCINKIVERIKDLETTIYNNKIKELNNMKVERYDNVEQLIKQVQLKQLIKTNDKGIKTINNSMKVLKQWSNKKTVNILFDSKVDGDGWINNVFHDRVLNRSNLYFILFDDSNNVFGGYVNTKIDKSDNYIHNYIRDENSFVFSLTRNGKLKKKKYILKKGKEDDAFALLNNNPNGVLFKFGYDIIVYKVGSDMSWCADNKRCWYDYKTDNKPLTSITYPDRFIFQRIIVLQMY